MNRIVVLLMAITLGGCLPDQDKDLAACQSEADRFYQGYNAVDPDDPRSQYIIECMATRGYEFDVLPAGCDSSRPFPNQPACYTPNRRFSWIIDRFRRALKSN
jgi:hypothetical protein